MQRDTRLKLQPILGIGYKGEYNPQPEDYTTVIVGPENKLDQFLRQEIIYLTKSYSTSDLLKAIRLNEKNKPVVTIINTNFDKKILTDVRIISKDTHPQIVDNIISLCKVPIISHARSQEEEKKLGVVPEKIKDNLYQIIDYAGVSHLEKQTSTLSQEELVTLFVLNEFSFYTEKRALSLIEYKEIAREMKFFGNHLPPNIHIIFSSFPVIWTSNEICNSVLYLQSGNKNKDASVYHFVKKTKSYYDPVFYNEKGAPHPTYKYGAKSLYHPDNDLKDSIIEINSKNQYESAIKIKTQAGKTFALVTDICLDHDKKSAINDFVKLAQKLQENKKSVPTQAIHVVSSNTIELKKENLLSETAIHADPFHNEKVGEDCKIEIPRKKLFFGSNFTLYHLASRFIEKIDPSYLPLKNDDSSQAEISARIK